MASESTHDPASGNRTDLISHILQLTHCTPTIFALMYPKALPVSGLLYSAYVCMLDIYMAHCFTSFTFQIKINFQEFNLYNPI